MTELIWINVWDRILCRWVKRLVSRSVAKAIPHFVAGAVMTCGPSIPTNSHEQLPPIPNQPLIPAINIPTRPIQPLPTGLQWTYVPQPYALTPPEGGWIAPGDFDEEQPSGSVVDINFRSSLTGVPSDTNTVPLGNVISNIPPKTPTVSEPITLSWFFGACALLVLLRRSEG